jgi:hypothetical protein
VVPPSISIDGRGRWVSTKVGVWNGGLGPHQPLPVGVVLPARRAELVRAHDLGPDARLALLGPRVVHAGAAAGAAQDRRAEAGGEHPLHEPVPGVPERRVGGLALAGGEAVQRDGEVGNAGA